ncbi:uncharacterized protein [Temnothorax nylanderi]|uniref:uncharacterized protein n=1 Tax=Temnothorax nylanderi TaxID=102681 RepID=UPI003A867AA5
MTGAVINTDHVEPRQFLEDACSVVCKRVRDIIKKHNYVKVNTLFNGEFVAGDKRANKSFNTNNKELCRTSHLREWYERHVIEPTLAKLEEFQERDSGWALTRILNLTVNVNRYNPLRAGCHLKLPQDIKTKNAVINVLSMDNACFAWSVVAALHPAVRHSERESSYPHYSTVLNVRDIEFPMTLSQIKKFERLNNISVNVYTIEGQKTSNVLPIRLTNRTSKKHVNLLYVQDPRDNNVGHFAWIKHLSRLVSSQINKHGHTKYICDRCLHYFSSSDKLQSHTVECREVNKCAIRLPSEDNKWLSFKNHSRKERLPFVVYADLECVLQKTQPETEHASYAYQHHRVCSIAYYVQCSYNETLSAYRFRRDNDCVAWFVEELKGLAHRVKNILSDIVCMVDLTRDEWETFHSAAQCHICEKPFAPNDNRVRDYCHLTGRHRGPAHSTCNLNYKDSHFIPVIFHNLSGYDAHCIIKEIAAAFEGSIDVLPITKEKYISFTKHVKDTAERSDSRSDIKLRFIDSYKFLSASLAKLASFLDKDKLKIIRSKFSALSNDDFELLTRKGVFPYEYVNSVEKLEDTCLPPRNSFYSSLTGETVSESDYAHAANVWQRFSVRTLGEYSDLCVASYGLDPAYYYTLPGFTWDAMLKHTCINFELLTDIDMVMFIERGIRGGLSQCSGRYAQANNKYMQSYDPLKPSSYLMYFDVNNLYGWAMCRPLPYAEFRWVEDVSKFDFNAIALDSPTGYILEVDLDRSVLSENLIAVELRKLEVKFNKPIYVGMCILDLSKVCLYEFHHEYMSPLYRDSCRIMYTDTDSLIYHIKCDDAYENMKRDIARFDTSDYAVDNAYGMSLVNKKVPGLMKDENNGAIMTEFVGLRAKMYALRVDGKKDCKKAKGVKSNVIARTITFDDYTRCLNDEIEMTRPQSCIRSKMHEVYTISETKIALSLYDDKRYIVPDSTDTLPWGHYRIPLYDKEQ